MLPDEKEIKALGDLEDLEGYDLVSGAGGELAGLIDCQGEVAQPVIDFLLKKVIQRGRSS